MKIGDLVRFKEPEMSEAYGVGIIVGEPQPGFAFGDLRGKYFDIPTHFKDEIVYAREEELEVICESR